MIIFYYWDFLPMFLVIMENNDCHYFFKDREVCNTVKNVKILIVENMKRLSYHFTLKIILS